MKLPKLIEPCPISEAAVEIRFETTLPGDAVFGVFYSAIQERYSDLEKLPILQLPEVVRMKDPNLIFQPHYRLKRDNFLVQMGPKTLSVIATKGYPGWQTFLSEIECVFDRVRDLGVIVKVTRFGIRYIDFFDLDIFKHLKLRILVDEADLVGENLLFRVEFAKGRFRSALQLSNDARLSDASGTRHGSALDLDTYLAADDIVFFENMRAILTEAHQIEKELFFGLLLPEFLETLNPTY